MDDNESLCSNLSWTSQLTTCESFSHMLSKQWGDDKLQRHVMELLISLRNTINQNGGSETPTEFYASLIALMKNTNLDLPTLEACGYLMKPLLSSGLSAAVIRHTSADITKIIKDVMAGQHASNENVIKFCLISLSKVLSVQNDENWKTDDVKNMYRILFSYICDDRKKINLYARKAVMSIFESKNKSSKPMSAKHPLHKETLAILTNNIRQQNAIHIKKNDTKNILADDSKLSYSLTVLSQLLQNNALNGELIVSYIEILIQCLTSMQIVPIQCQILNIFKGLFAGNILSPEILARSLTSLFAYINLCTGTDASSITKTPPTFLGKTWLRTVLHGFAALMQCKETTFIDTKSKFSRNCREVALAQGTALIKICSDWLLCQDFEMKESANTILNKLCSCQLVSEKTDSNYLDPNEYDDVEKWLIKWVETLGRHLSTQNEAMWSEILENVTNLVIKSDGKCPNFIAAVLNTLPKLAEIRDSYEHTEAEIIASLTSSNFKNARTDLTPLEKKLKTNIESLIGSIVKIYGVDKVLDILPLIQIVNEETNTLRDLNNRTWLVPLMKQYVQNTSLDKFRQYFLPFIQVLTDKIDTLSARQAMEVDDTTGNDSATVAIASLGTLRYQLWTCLPCFAKNVVPGGIEEVSNHHFQNNTLWELLLNFLNPAETSNLETIAMTTIRNIVKTAQDQDEMKRVLTSNLLFPKFLSSLFSQYMKKDQNIQNTVRITLSAYLRIFEPERFATNIDFLINKKLADIDINKTSEDHALCVDLIIILAPHLTIEKMAEVTNFISRFLDSEADNHLQKKAYRYFEVITASDTPTSNDFTKLHMQEIISKFMTWKKVKNDSWKCRIKSLYNLLKLLNTSREVADFLNGFLPEIISCLNLKTKKTRAVSGLILVEGILLCSSLSEDENTTLSHSINLILQNIISSIREHLDDTDKGANSFKEALSKALFLVLSESRLNKAVTREHIESAMSVVTDILRGHKSENENKQLVLVALDILAGLAKGMNFSRLEIKDFGGCLRSAATGLLKKVRNPVKRILRKLLKWWSYEEIKACLPEELVSVLRNLHKEGNRANKTKEKADADTKSNNTSWKCFSETASNNTMQNPHIKNIIELLEDSDDEQDLRTQMSGVSLSNKSMGSLSHKSMASNGKSVKSQLRTIRKRKIAEANATLWLDEKDGEIIDISDNVQMAQHTRFAQDGAEPVENPSKTLKNSEFRGFKMEGGRLLIGNAGETETVGANQDDSDDEEDNRKSKKGRFEAPKKHARREKRIGAEYKSHKKGVLGDMATADKPKPYAYVPLTGNFHGLMKTYDKETKKCLKATRQVSKMSRLPKTKKK